MESSSQQKIFSLSIQLSPMEAKGLAHLCHVLDWELLAEHSRIASQAMEARYALAKLRFALSDAGYLAMPEKGTDQLALESRRIFMWDERYQAEEFVYGKNPNDFLVSAIDQVPPGGRLLSLGEGEGRNAIFLAKKKFNVTALDLSEVGLNKAQKLAAEENVRIETLVADLSLYTIPPESYDVIVSIFCHLPPELQSRVNKNIVSALKPGGFLILEGFSREQLAFTSGGPRSPEMLLELDNVRGQLQGLEFVIARQLEKELSEGSLHRGRCSVVQILARK